jgi:hypothetical protein
VPVISKSAFSSDKSDYLWLKMLNSPIAWSHTWKISLKSYSLFNFLLRYENCMKIAWSAREIWLIWVRYYMGNLIFRVTQNVDRKRTWKVNFSDVHIKCFIKGSFEIFSCKQTDLFTNWKTAHASILPHYWLVFTYIHYNF